MHSYHLPEFQLTGAVESLLKSSTVELSLDCELFSISIPQDQGKYLVHQVQPLYLAKLNKTGRSPGVSEGAVKDRLTHCPSSVRYGRIGDCFFKVYSFRSAVFWATGSPHRMWPFTTHRQTWVQRGDNPHLPPLENAYSPLWLPVSPLGNPVTPVRPGRLPLTPPMGVVLTHYGVIMHTR